MFEGLALHGLSAVPARSLEAALGGGTRDTKPNVVVRVVRRVVVAVGGTHVVRVVVPRAAAKHAVRR